MGARIAVALAAVVLVSACATSTAAGPPPSVPPPPGMAYLPDGDWVQTQEYGWVWMPYSDQFTYLPPGGVGEPLEYVFYPSVGWAWVAAPWVWGYGPMPAFGRRGPGRFAWYEHGWWREPRRWRYRPAPEPERHAARGVRPAPVLPRPAPAPPAGPRAAPSAQGRPGGERSGAIPRPGGRARGGERERGERDRDRDGDRDRDRDGR